MHALSSPPAALRAPSARAGLGAPVAARPAALVRPQRQRGAPATGIVCIAAGYGDFAGSNADVPSPRATPAPTPRRANATNSTAGVEFPAADEQLRLRALDGGLPRNQALPLSLLHKFDRLPAEGKTKYEIHQPCTISSEQECKLDTQVQVWERPCVACNGSGFARSRWGGRAKAMTAVCMACSGLGAVRCASTRLSPRIGPGSTDTANLGRTDPPPHPQLPPLRRE